MEYFKKLLYWERFGRNDLVVNISSCTLSTLEMEAPYFVLKFATYVKNHDMGKLIDINHRHQDSDF